MQSTIKNRTIFCRDNLDILNGINSNSIDLIYLDPPFNKNDTFVGSDKKIQGIKEWYQKRQKEKKEFVEVDFDKMFEDTPYFEDIWNENDITSFYYTEIDNYNSQLVNYLESIRNSTPSGSFHYLLYMSIRLIEMKRALKDAGSIYYHCDSHLSHYVKNVMDKIFGNENFRNEIVWHYRRWTGTAKMFQKLHDTLFFYVKNKDKYNFNTIYTDYTKMSKERKEQGVLNRFNNKGETYRVSYKTLDKKGVRENDVWHIPFIPPSAKERVGYPTQKPLKLLERIIKASSNEGDVVLDPFLWMCYNMHSQRKIK